MGSWGDWEDCSEECGGGKQTREYTISKAAENGGAECIKSDGEIEERNCNEEVCPVDCVGGWGNWSACSKSCDPGDGPGIRRRNYRITTQKVGAGSDCDGSNEDGFEETETCNEQRCPIPCEGGWGDWSSCSKTCDNGDGPGKQTRTYNVTVSPQFNGTDCLSNNNSWNEKWWGEGIDENDLSSMFDNHNNKRLYYIDTDLNPSGDSRGLLTLDEAYRMCKANNECGGFRINKKYPGNYEQWNQTEFSTRDNSKVMVNDNDYISYTKKEGVYNINNPEGKPGLFGFTFERNGLVQERECDIQKCPENCSEGWGPYGECVPSHLSERDKYTGEKCGKGKKESSWVVHKEAKYGGNNCVRSGSSGRETKSIECNLSKRCAEDCVTGFGDWSECKTENSRCGGVQEKKWTDIEPPSSGGKCPEGSYKNCRYSHQCDDYTLKNGETMTQKCYEKAPHGSSDRNVLGERECYNSDPSGQNNPFNSGCQTEERGKCHIVLPWKTEEYKKCTLEGAPSENDNSGGFFPRPGPGFTYNSCADISDRGYCNNKNPAWGELMGNHCKWENGSCISKVATCESYGNDYSACYDDSNCDYNDSLDKCVDMNCYDLWDQDTCRNRGDCEWNSNMRECSEKEFPCVSDSKMAQHRGSSQNCTDDPQWESIDGYKCEDIGSAIIKSECSSGLLYTYNKDGVRVDDACPSSCEVEGCHGSSASSVPSYVDDV